MLDLTNRSDPFSNPASQKGLFLYVYLYTKKQALFFLGMTFAIFMADCDSRGPSQFGAQMNETRKCHRLPIIPDDWLEDYSHWIWRNPKGSAIGFVGHCAKSVVARNHDLQYETDEYILTKTYPDRNPDLPEGSMRNETISITYYYSNGDFNCTYENDNGLHDIPLKEAEAILRKDRISHLNYAADNPGHEKERTN
jgi:hypothetical protein